MIERTATELLTEAREFIAEPERWCQGYLALDGHGKRIQPGLVTNVARCCGLGAAELAAARHGLVESWLELTRSAELLELAASDLYPPSAEHDELSPVAYVNDKLGHAAILRVYDAAIAASQETNE